MQGLLTFLFATVLSIGGAACSDSDDSGTGGEAGAGGAGGTGFEASAAFANVVVGDGAESTNIDVTLDGRSIDTDIVYLGTGVRADVELDEQAADVAAEASLSSDQRVLTPAATIPLRAGTAFSVYVLGEIAAVQGTFAPRFVTLETLGPPVDGSFRVRALHGVAGFDAPVDVYANGTVFSALGYGDASEPIDLATGAPNTDSLVVTDAGVPPNEATDIFRTFGVTLFEGGASYDLVVSREPSGSNGDINGAVSVLVSQVGESD